MTTKKVVKKSSRPAERAEKIAPVEKAEPIKVAPVETEADLQARLNAFRLADARVRLERAMDRHDPDATLAIMEEISKLENA